jgi:hypothetical protein
LFHLDIWSSRRRLREARPEMSWFL